MVRKVAVTNPENVELLEDDEVAEIIFDRKEYDCAVVDAAYDELYARGYNTADEVF